MAPLSASFTVTRTPDIPSLFLTDSEDDDDDDDDDSITIEMRPSMSSRVPLIPSPWKPEGVSTRTSIHLPTPRLQRRSSPRMLLTPLYADAYTSPPVGVHYLKPVLPSPSPKSEKMAIGSDLRLSLPPMVHFPELSDLEVAKDQRKFKLKRRPLRALKRHPGSAFEGRNQFKWANEAC